MGRKPSTDASGQLTHLLFQILLSLGGSEEPKHGYLLIKEIEDRNGGRYRVGAGSLYRALRKLEGAGFVREVDPQIDEHAQRRFYMITPEGRARVREEARFVRALASWANLVVPEDA